MHIADHPVLGITMAAAVVSEEKHSDGVVHASPPEDGKASPPEDGKALAIVMFCHNTCGFGVGR